MKRNPNQAGPERERDMREAMQRLQGKSEPELLAALRDATDRERAAGTLDNTRMDDIYEKLSPYLTEAQREKMRTVIARLKE